MPDAVITSSPLVTRIVEVRNFGINVSDGDRSALVHLPELSWSFPYNHRQDFQVDQEIVVVRCVWNEYRYLSFRQQYSDNDWVKNIAVGDVIEAIVIGQKDDNIRLGVAENSFDDFLIHKLSGRLFERSGRQYARLVVDHVSDLSHVMFIPA